MEELRVAKGGQRDPKARGAERSIEGTGLAASSFWNTQAASRKKLTP